MWRWLLLRVWSGAVLLAALAACGTRLPPVEPGYYRVVRGDTLFQISRQTGRTVGELRRWNGLTNVHQIRAGQVLRVVPPGNATTSAGRSVAPKPAPNSTPKPAVKPMPVKPATEVPAIRLARPAQGRIIQPYSASSRGITIANQAGTAVVAAAAGSVAYASNGLPAYGNLVIIQHDRHHLTIYAHNRRLLVKEGQQVGQGQRIAEMGNTGSNRAGKPAALYFELRRDGQPVDPSGMFR